MPAAAGSTSPRRVIVLAINYVTWQELRSAQLPNISRFLQDASVGLMNTKGPRDNDPESVWVTLGAGRGAAAGVRELKLDESDPAIAARVTNVAELVTMNRRRATQARPGELGELLGQKGVERALVWAHDAPNTAAALVMDQQGNVPHLFRLDPAHPEAVQWLIIGDNSFTVINLALPESSPARHYPGDRATSPARGQALKQADLLLAGILAVTDKDDLVALLSPACPEFANPHSRALAPIALRGPGFGGGLLASDSTRRSGLVTSVDFAPTVLRFFDLAAPLVMVGRPLQASPSPAPLARLDSIDRQIAVAYRLRDEFIPWFAAIGGALLVMVIVLLVCAPRLSTRINSWLKALMLLLSSTPLALFLLSATPITSAFYYLLFVGLLSALFTLAASLIKRGLGAFGVICAATALALWLDLLAGSPLLMRSLLGYVPIDGSRFYGLGNAEAGLFASALIVAVAILLDGLRRPLSLGARSAIVGLVVGAVFSVGLTILGANWGQGLSSTVAVLTLWVLLGPARRRRWRLLAGGLMFAAVAAVLIGFDTALPVARQSHLAYSVRLIASQGPLAIYAIIKRKLGMAVRVSGFSPFGILTIPIIGALILLRSRTPQRLKYIIIRRRVLFAALTACAVGGVAATVLNDSGIVAGMSFIWLPMAALIFLGLEALGENTGS